VPEQERQACKTCMGNKKEKKEIDNTRRSCMLFIRNLYSDLLMQRSLDLPGWTLINRTDFDRIIMMLEREKSRFEVRHTTRQ